MPDVATSWAFDGAGSTLRWRVYDRVHDAPLRGQPHACSKGIFTYSVMDRARTNCDGHETEASAGATGVGSRGECRSLHHRDRYRWAGLAGNIDDDRHLISWRYSARNHGIYLIQTHESWRQS